MADLDSRPPLPNKKTNPEVTTCGHCGAAGVMRATIHLDHRVHADDCPRRKDRDDR